MIKKYRDKIWLEKKYSEEKLTMHKIGQICGVCDATIFNWLKKYNTLTRSISEAIHLSTANHCNLSQEAIDWISGELLGDGCLISISIYSAYFTYSSKYSEYIQYVSDTLKSFGIKGRKIYKSRRTIESYSYNYASLCYTELLPIRKKWYPEGKKIIPKDILLTPLTLRQHFIGDGSLEHGRRGRPFIILYTNGFSIPDVKWLVEQLIKLGFKATRRPTRNLIAISTYSTKKFLDYIGKCPVKCYKYKWEY